VNDSNVPVKNLDGYVRSIGINGLDPYPAKIYSFDELTAKFLKMANLATGVGRGRLPV
jgi:hypothetical protein